MNVLLLGAGPMAVDYAKVLVAQGATPVTIGREAASAQKFTAETGLPVVTGGLEAYHEPLPERAIVAVGEKSIGQVAKALLARGVRELLLEKPGGFDAADIREVAALAGDAKVYVGYNRRHYASAAAAKAMIAEDGGVTSFTFEFTEWGHVIAGLQKEEGVKEQWFLSNSTHLIDLAFYLGGKPETLCAFAQGGLDWHPQAAVFAGAGRSVAGALFSYQANWAAPGRFVLEVLTRKRRLIFRPIEKLQVQQLGSVAVEFAEIDDQLDQAYKPGLYKQVEAFLQGGAGLPTIAEQVEMLDWYLRIRGDLACPAE